MRRIATAMTAIGLAAALALALLVWLPADDDLVEIAIDGKANGKPVLRSAASPALLDSRAPASTAGAPTMAPAAVLPVPAAITAVTVPVSITVTAPQTLLVGEMSELAIGVKANAGVSEIGLTVQFDATVLQVRGSTQGDWASGPGFSPRFAAEISSAEDRVQIRSTMSAPHSGAAGGSVAIVQFQALVPGTTTVLVTDVIVKDSAGKSIASAVSASNLQLTVDSIPTVPNAAPTR